MILRVHNKLGTFDFDESYFKICKKINHLSFCSVFLHFLRCLRSCDKLPNYCKYCSRVRDNNFFDHGLFNDLIVDFPYCDNENRYLYMSDKIVDLDVFLERPSYLHYGQNHPLRHKKCRYFTLLSFAQDLFAYFTSILMRMYLNYATEHFSELISILNLADEKFVIEQISACAHELLRDFYDVNYNFF